MFKSRIEVEDDKTNCIAINRLIKYIVCENIKNICHNFIKFLLRNKIRKTARLDVLLLMNKTKHPVYFKRNMCMTNRHVSIHKRSLPFLMLLSIIVPFRSLSVPPSLLLKLVGLPKEMSLESDSRTPSKGNR